MPSNHLIPHILGVSKYLSLSTNSDDIGWVFPEEQGSPGSRGEKGNLDGAGLSKSREREGSSSHLYLKKLFILIGGELLYSIVVVSAIH